MVVLVTGAGAPGFMGTFKSLVHNYDKRKIHIIGVDSREDVIGKYYCEFHQIPKATDPNYLDTMYMLGYSADVILPQNTAELEILANSGLTVAVSNKVDSANNKLRLLEICNKIGIPHPEYYTASTKEELLSAVYLLGYPKNRVIVKPPVSNGSRGVRIIDESVDYKKMFYEDKANNFITLKNLLEILGDEFPELIVQEYLYGDEYTVDCFRGNRFVAIPRLREEIKNGISFKTRTIKDEKLIEYSQRIAEELDLLYAFGFQFRGGKILECNPRVQGTMVASTFAGANIIYSAAKYRIGEDVPEFDVDWDARLIRFWGSKPI